MASGLLPPGEGPTFDYAGTSLHVLAGDDGSGPFSAAEMNLPAGFRGPIPHAHDTFDESIYVISGVILAGVDYDDPAEAPAGSLLTALRGTRHFFSNPFDEPARVLGLWSPPVIGLAFIRVVGAALPAFGPPDPEAMQAIYEEHGSRLLP
ncbi:MAG: cupin domain-containing protein [Actinomycetota bacterium]|nr:cupin domain-containing protein [Actinomycetota bacterium]